MEVQRNRADWQETVCVKMTSLKKIATDLLKGKLPSSASAELARERLKVCEQCEYFARLTRQCRLCSCFMDAKTKILEAECPMQKW